MQSSESTAAKIPEILTHASRRFKFKMLLPQLPHLVSFSRGKYESEVSSFQSLKFVFGPGSITKICRGVLERKFKN
jgi:hypothetical protein